MGGVKKKPVGSSKSNSQQPSEGSTKPKKDEGKTFSKAQKHKSSVLIDDLNDMNILKGMKSITAQAVSKILGVKISIANNYLKNLESKGVVNKIGGYSGHRVYAFVRDKQT
jgi:small subunit ribosomal protein S25e